jgi:hypothetical protein
MVKLTFNEKKKYGVKKRYEFKNYKGKQIIIHKNYGY